MPAVPVRENHGGRSGKERIFAGVTLAAFICFLYLVLGEALNWNYRSTTFVGGATLARRGLLHFGDWNGEPIVEDSKFLGFHFARFNERITGRKRVIIDVPYWPFIFVASLPQFLWFRHEMKKAARHGPGFCRSCNYDLRASVDRCPECGTPIDHQTGSATQHS